MPQIWYEIVMIFVYSMKNNTHYKCEEESIKIFIATVLAVYLSYRILGRWLLVGDWWLSARNKPMIGHMIGIDRYFVVCSAVSVPLVPCIWKPKMRHWYFDLTDSFLSDEICDHVLITSTNKNRPSQWLTDLHWNIFLIENSEIIVRLSRESISREIICISQCDLFVTIWPCRAS